MSTLEYFGVPPAQKGQEYRLEEKIAAADSPKTVFLTPYTVGMVDVFINGLIQPLTTFSAVDGQHVTLTVGATTDQIVKIISRSTAPIGLNNSYTQGQADARFATKTELNTKADASKVPKRGFLYMIGNN